jgi:hypothetical protein
MAKRGGPRDDFHVEYSNYVRNAMLIWTAAPAEICFIGRDCMKAIRADTHTFLHETNRTVEEGMPEEDMPVNHL